MKHVIRYTLIFNKNNKLTQESTYILETLYAVMYIQYNKVHPGYSTTILEIKISSLLRFDPMALIIPVLYYRSGQSDNSLIANPTWWNRYIDTSLYVAKGGL